MFVRIYIFRHKSCKPTIDLLTNRLNLQEFIYKYDIVKNTLATNRSKDSNSKSFLPEFGAILFSPFLLRIMPLEELKTIYSISGFKMVCSNKMFI
jgi:hypothetical protein